MQAPILVMEFLPTNLTSCIEQVNLLPKDISYSMLHDVALGLCYLHSQTPPIIHRDLSSNNVLLTPNMTAKISDLGVARILNLTPLQVSRMTQTPGTPTYMPPEVMIANPKYDTSVDEFSYGIMMIHVFSGQWPEPQVGPIRTESDGKLIPVTEVERREIFLQTIGNDHPLMDLIQKCIQNHPNSRARASEIVEQLAEMVSQFPALYSNRLEMLRQFDVVNDDRRALAEEGERKDGVIRQMESQISSLSQKIQAKKEQQTTEMDRLKLAHRNEVEQLRLKIQDLSTQHQLVLSMKDAKLAELKSHAALNKTKIETDSKSLLQEREINKKLRSKKTALQYTVSELQANVVEKDNVIEINAASIKRKDSELQAKCRALKEKDATISAMSEQLTKTRDYLATEKQVSTQCKEFPKIYQKYYVGLERLRLVPLDDRLGP